MTLQVIILYSNNAGRLQSSLCSNPPTSSRWYLVFIFLLIIFLNTAFSKTKTHLELNRSRFLYFPNLSAEGRKLKLISSVYHLFFDHHVDLHHDHHVDHHRHLSQVLAIKLFETNFLLVLIVHLIFFSFPRLLRLTNFA
jgi:hypothetical protein